MARIIKTVKGRQYAYEQTSYRVGKKVRTKSKYLGPVRRMTRAIGAFIEANRTRGFINEEEALRAFNERVDKEKAAQVAALDTLHGAYGLKMGPMQPSEKELGGQPQGSVVSEVNSSVAGESTSGGSQGDENTS